MSQNENDTTIDQLWYTWSHKGLGEIYRGYRIRAASIGLHSIRNIRVKALDRFQRYQLPQGADPVVAQSLRHPDANDGLNVAPICLSLIDTGQERILVRKVYTGRDALGRPGVFFVHLLAGLPENFTATYAIQLWNSPFWQRSDVTLQDEYSTLLDQISLEHLIATIQPLSYKQQHIKCLDNYLAYVINAYLLMKDSSIRKAEHIARQLYIAASDENIVRLIRGLTRCIPQPILSHLTFSTYERNLADAETEIVGTGWLTISGAERNENTKRLLPARFYQNRIALNCYSGEHAPLINNPFIEDKPIAATYAYRAKQYFLEAIRKTFTPEGERFKMFLDAEQDCANVEKLLKDFELFLQHEQRSIEPGSAISPDAPSPTTSTMPGAIGAISGLSTPERSPVDIIREAIPSVVETIEVEIETGEPAAPHPTKIATCEQLVAYMKNSIPPGQESELWIELLLRLRSIPTISSFFFTSYHWDCYVDLMGLFVASLSDANNKSTLLAPLLAPTWAMLGAFFQLPLPPGWTILALKTLAFDGTMPTADDAHNIAELSHNRLKEMCNVFWLEEEYQRVAILLISKLTRVGYRKKMDIVQPLLAKGAKPQTIEWLLSVIRSSLTKDDLALIFEEYVATYIPYYPDSLVLLDYLRDYFHDIVHDALASSNIAPEDPFRKVRRKIERVVDCIVVVIMNTAANNNAIILLQKLAFICTDDVRAFKELMRGLEKRWLTNELSSLHLFLFFYDVAIYVSEGIANDKRKQTLLFPCIIFADTLSTFLAEKQGTFIHIFTKTLLLYADKTIFKHLLHQVHTERRLKNVELWKEAIQQYQKRRLLSLTQMVWHTQKELQHIDPKDIVYKLIETRFENKPSLIRAVYTFQTYDMRTDGRAWITNNIPSDNVVQEAHTTLFNRNV